MNRLDKSTLSRAEQTKLDLLEIALSVSVPLFIEELRHLSPRQRNAVARECAKIVAEKGDLILYKSKKSGETARAFNALAKGVAAAAYAPGGVDIFHLHFEARSTDEN